MKKLKFYIYYLQELVLQCAYKVKLLLQKVCCGFNEQEINQLNGTMIDLILPRLKAFQKDEQIGKKLSREIDAMIWSLENLFAPESFTTKEGIDKVKFTKHQNKLAKGLALFGAIWWRLEK
jgi:hypothetical protein